jgi:NodT family efflux transporter outer membrane factor (OMF) lipoprotein
MKEIFPYPTMLILVLLILIFTACIKVGPDFTKPDAPEPSTWIQKDDPTISTTDADLTAWWTVFDDPVLNNLIQTAHEQNLPLRIAGLRVLEARAQMAIAVGNQYPQTQRGVGGYQRANLSENAANRGMADPNYGEYNLGLDAAWEMDFWGKFRRAVESEAANLEASVAGYDNVMVTLTAEVATTYVLIRTLQEQLAIAHRNVEIQQRSLRIAEVRFDAGLVTELDVTQARSLLKNTQASIPRLRADMRSAKNALAVLLGMLPEKIDTLLIESRPIPQAPAQVAVGIPANLLRRRPDIRRAELQVAAQSARIGIARADLFPHFSLTGSIGFRTGDRDNLATPGDGIKDLIESDSLEFFAGPSFRWDILNYGRIANRVRLEDARFQQQVTSYEETVLQAAREVEDAMVSFLRTQEEVAFRAESVQASKRSVDLSSLQYREGLVDFQRVLDTQRFLAQEEDRLAATSGSVALNLIAMYRALGGGWETRVGKELIPEETKEKMRDRTNWGGMLDSEKVKQPSWWWPY